MARGKRLATWVWTLLIFVPVAAAQTYDITDLGTFPGGTVSQGQSISRCGDVAGYARFANYNAHGFFWSGRGGLRDLGAIPPQSHFSVAQAIDDFGNVAGYSTYDILLHEHAVVWIQGRLHDLGTLPGGMVSEAMGMNNRGEIVGFSDGAGISPHAFLWSARDGMQDLGTLARGYYSQALAINLRGEVAGYSNAADGNWHGFRWTKSTGMQQLATLPGGYSASANGINNLGQVVGGSASGSGDFAVLWNRDNTIENLGALPGQGWSTAFAISNRGQVVGWSGFRAFIWSRDEGMQDLNGLIPRYSGWLLTSANAISVHGQITGEGAINGQTHAFLLTPISEPRWACN